MKINIGCGNSKMDGFKNIDVSPIVNPDECYDIQNGIQEKDDSVDEIFAGCVLEQVDDLGFVMNECWRVLKTDGVLRGYVPSTDSKVLFQDPMDKRFFQESTFNYFVEEHNYWKEFGKQYGYKPWKSVETEINPSGILHFILTK
jgi:ubiquinone/menaquinone biosynthesis C-methylase UbiE